MTDLETEVVVTSRPVGYLNVDDRSRMSQLASGPIPAPASSQPAGAASRPRWTGPSGRHPGPASAGERGCLLPVCVAVGQPGARGVDSQVADAVTEHVDDGAYRGADLAGALDQGPGPVHLRCDDRALDQVGRQRGGLTLGRVDDRAATAADVVEESGAATAPRAAVSMTLC